jgi:hypothetical protein
MGMVTSYSVDAGTPDAYAIPFGRPYSRLLSSHRLLPPVHVAPVSPTCCTFEPAGSSVRLSASVPVKVSRTNWLMGSAAGGAAHSCFG